MSILPAAPRLIFLPLTNAAVVDSYAPGNYWPAVTRLPFGSKDR
jgi:hypothetical protein